MTGSISKGYSCSSIEEKKIPNNNLRCASNENIPQSKGMLCCCCPKKPVTTKKKRYCQPSIPDSFAPRRFYQRACALMDDGTIYKMSYKPMENVDTRTPAVVHQGNLTLSSGRISGDTIHKLSYLPNTIQLSQPFIPCDHDLSGKGPMQNLTTNKHDYVPKPNSRRNPIEQRSNLTYSRMPLEDKTVNRLSYASPGIQAKPQSYAPIRNYYPPKGTMDCSTVQKLSYRPNPVRERQTPPWAKKPVYRRPCGVIGGDTVYNLSYLPPGEECDDYTENSCCCASESNIACCPYSVKCPQEYMYECPRASC